MFDIVYLLTGDPVFPPSLDSLLDRYVEKRKFDIEYVAWCAHYIDRQLAGELISAFEALPEAHKLHLLLSPVHFEAVHRFRKHPSPATIQALVTLARDEACIVAGVELPGHRDDAEVIWSPLGDESLRRTADGWARRSGDKLDSLILMDFESPQARELRPDSPVMCYPAEEFTDSERAAVLTKLQAALTYIDDIVPTFGRLIRNYTRAIRMRKLEIKDGFSSEHVTNTIGEIRLLNAQREEICAIRLAEALIHESVHNLLSSYEYINQSFVFSLDQKQFRPVSPWTGNAIPVASFCHAVFVWYSLFHFAVRELQEPNLTEEQTIEIMRRRNNYASGFMVPTPLSDCIRELGTFEHSILATIDSLQSIVRSFVEGKEAVAFAPQPVQAVPLAV